MFVYFHLFLKLCNKCEYVIVGAVLSEHGKKCDIAVVRHCHTQPVINVHETVETESCITVKCIQLRMISASTELYLNHTSSCDLDL